jgi:hypothetical protein
MKRTLIIGAIFQSVQVRLPGGSKTQSVTDIPYCLLIGRRKGAGIRRRNSIWTKIKWEDVDTVTLYINPSHQPEYYDYISFV